jgi:hypothetical protein
MDGITTLIMCIKNFSILIGWEQCGFEEVQHRRKKHNAENTVQILHKNNF